MYKSAILYYVLHWIRDQGGSAPFNSPGIMYGSLIAASFFLAPSYYIQRRLYTYDEVFYRSVKRLT